MNTPVAKIIGLRDGFDLIESIRMAQTIEIIVAFAKRSGWMQLRDALLTGQKRINIVVGLNFGITDPDVLSEWLALQESRPNRFRVRVAPLDPVFHPKVILVRRSNGDWFSIIGSGNLTSGGLSANVECGVLLERRAEVEELIKWKAGLSSVPLTDEIIKTYRPLYDITQRVTWSSEGRASKLKALLIDAKISGDFTEAPPWNSDLFISDMNRFVATLKGQVKR